MPDYGLAEGHIMLYRTSSKKAAIARIVSWAATAFVGLSAFAAPQAKPEVFRAGAATSNITLPLGARNGGVIARGAVATQIHDELHARCLVLDDGRTKVAIAVCDLRMIDRAVVEEARKLACEATGIPAANVLISATHTHGAPGVIGMHTEEIDRWYRGFLIRRIADGIRRANLNLAPARIGWGVGSVPDQTFNRRWRMREGTVPANPFGEKGDTVQMNPPRQSPNLIEPAGPADPGLTALSVRRSDGRPLALLANYSVHYVGGYQGGHVSADYFGVFSSRMAQLLETPESDPPFVAIMSNGTSGDLNNINFLLPRQSRKPWERMREVGFEMADKALQVVREIEHSSDVSLAAAFVDLELRVRRPDAKRIAWARKTQQEAVKGRPGIYAEETLQLAKFPASVPVRLQVIRIGRLGIAAIPCEVFAETGLAIKEQSPLDATFTIELANGYNGYLPTRQQHAWGGYETWPARSAYLEIGAEEKIRKAVRELLRQVAEE